MRPRPIEGALPRDDERPDGGRAGRPGPADPAHLEGVRSRRSDEGHQPGTSGENDRPSRSGSCMPSTTSVLGAVLALVQALEARL